MSCPDVNDLMDLWQGRISDPEMVAHTETCAECQENLELFGALREVYEPRIEVPEDLTQRTLARLDQVVAEERKRSLRWNTLGAGVLGGLTVAAAVLVAGAEPGPTLPNLLTIALVAGAMAGLAQFKWPGEWKLSFS